MTCSGSPGLVVVGSEVNPGSPSSVSQLPCACCPSEPGQSGPVGWGGTPRRGPTSNGRLPCSLALGGTLRSVGGHMGVVRELHGRDLSGPGVARLLQKWDPEPHPGARLLARSSTGQGGEVAVSAASVRGAADPARCWCSVPALLCQAGFPLPWGPPDPRPWPGPCAPGAHWV